MLYMSLLKSPPEINQGVCQLRMLLKSPPQFNQGACQLGIICDTHSVNCSPVRRNNSNSHIWTTCHTASNSNRCVQRPFHLIQLNYRGASDAEAFKITAHVLIITSLIDERRPIP